MYHSSNIWNMLKNKIKRKETSSRPLAQKNISEPNKNGKAIKRSRKTPPLPCSIGISGTVSVLAWVINGASCRCCTTSLSVREMSGGPEQLRSGALRWFWSCARFCHFGCRATSNVTAESRTLKPFYVYFMDCCALRFSIETDDKISTPRSRSLPRSFSVVERRNLLIFAAGGGTCCWFLDVQLGWGWGLEGKQRAWSLMFWD